MKPIKPICRYALAAADIRRELKALTAAGLLAEKTTYTKGAKA